jgi:serine/threonine-protein kinase RsbW
MHNAYKRRAPHHGVFDSCHPKRPELVTMDNLFTISIDSDIARIPDVSARLEEAMQAFGFGPEAILDTQLAVEEAITNVIVHGYKGPDGKIGVSCRFLEKSMVVQITDASPRFDPMSIPEPDINADVEERQIGGLGIYLIRRVMDDISYQYENGMNILRLTKNKTES